MEESLEDVKESGDELLQGPWHIIEEGKGFPLSIFVEDEMETYSCCLCNNVCREPLKMPCHKRELICALCMQRNQEKCCLCGKTHEESKYKARKKAEKSINEAKTRCVWGPPPPIKRDSDDDSDNERDEDETYEMPSEQKEESGDEMDSHMYCHAFMTVTELEQHLEEECEVQRRYLLQVERKKELEEQERSMQDLTPQQQHMFRELRNKVSQHEKTIAEQKSQIAALQELTNKHDQLLSRIQQNVESLQTSLVPMPEYDRIQERPHAQAWDMASQPVNNYHFGLVGMSGKFKMTDKIKGCVFGAAVGDSIGSYLENSRVTETKLAQAMKMPGGGDCWKMKLNPGQGTDDTELSVCIARGLKKMIEHNKQNRTPHNVNMQFVAKEYQIWYENDPFDLGVTIQSCFQHAPNTGKMHEFAKKKNKQNAKKGGQLSSGSLMRCIPLIIYGLGLAPKEYLDLMIADSKLTHANWTVYYVNTCYALGIRLLLSRNERSTRHDDAFKIAMDFLEREREELKYDEEQKRRGSSEDKPSRKEGCEMVIALMEEVQEKRDQELASLKDKNAFSTHIKRPFQFAFHHLLNKVKFEDAIRETLRIGGKTDTNACVVGGMMGAYWGIHEIPKDFIEKIMNCEPKVIRDHSLEHKKKYQARVFADEGLLEFLLHNALKREQMSGEIRRFEDV